MKKALMAVALLGALGAAGLVSANHSWGGYHWARTANPFTLKLGDNVNANWDSYLAQTSAAWSADPATLYPTAGIAKVLNLAVVSGATSPKTCKATPGMVQVCNSTYGKNGWLGLAQIWISGGHITQGVAKMNDTYFNMAAYNNAAEKLHVMCQEVGHTFGLGHTSEDGTSQGTCMDYSSSANSTLPNQHDYEQLASIYAHLDSTNSYSTASATSRGMSAAAQAGDFSNAAEWGKAVAQDAKGRNNQFVRDLGHGNLVITEVHWVDENQD